MGVIRFAVLMLLVGGVFAGPLDETRCCVAEIRRDADGKIARRADVLRAFRDLYPCPSTGRTHGACPGWNIDHSIPLACRGPRCRCQPAMAARADQALPRRILQGSVGAQGVLQPKLMPDPGAVIIKFPPLYRVAYSDGDECGFVEGCQFRQFWQAEEALYHLQAKYPGLILWVTWKPTD